MFGDGVEFELGEAGGVDVRGAGQSGEEEPFLAVPQVAFDGGGHAADPDRAEQFVFGRCDPWILEQIALRPYDGYLLCRPDLPWAPDPLREYPEGSARDQLFHIYRDCLINHSTPWAEIGGQGEERIVNGIAAVEHFLAAH